MKRDTAPRRDAYIDMLRRQHWCAGYHGVGEGNNAGGGGAAGRRCGVGLATRFVSHAWSYPFVDVVETLSGLVATRDDESEPMPGQALEEEFFWLDFLVLNQHDVRTSEAQLPHDHWNTTLCHAMRTIDSAVVVLSPRDNPEPMQRSWVAWKIRCTETDCSSVDEPETDWSSIEAAARWHHARFCRKRAMQCKERAHKADASGPDEGPPESGHRCVASSTVAAEKEVDKTKSKSCADLFKCDRAQLKQEGLNRDKVVAEAKADAAGTHSFLDDAEALRGREELVDDKPQPSPLPELHAGRNLSASPSPSPSPSPRPQPPAERGQAAESEVYDVDFQRDSARDDGWELQWMDTAEDGTEKQYWLNELTGEAQWVLPFGRKKFVT